MFEAEDPVHVGDRVSPINGPTEDYDGNPIPESQRDTAVNVGVPDLSVIVSLYGADTQAADSLACTADYVTGRGWLSSLTAIGDLSSIESRYEPSGSQWAMRCLAQSNNKEVAQYYMDNLIVSEGSWALAN